MTMQVECPRCQSAYQVDESLRGRKMRCPNSICRHVFEVQGPDAVAPASAPPVSQTERPSPPREFAPRPAWMESPPPVRGADEAPTATPSQPLDEGPDLSQLEQELAEETSAAALVYDGEAPPVRSAPGVMTIEPPRLETAVAAPPPVKRARRRALALVAALVIALGGLAALGVYLAQRRGASDEATLAQKAAELYHDQNFGEAASVWDQLQRDFPKSGERDHYRFLAELSAVRAAADLAREAPLGQDALERTLEFLAVYQNNPFLKEKHADVFLTLYRLTNELSRWADSALDRRLLTSARRAWIHAQKYQPPPAINPPEVRKQTEEAFARLEKRLAARTQRDNDLAQMQAWLKAPSVEAYLAARALIERGSYQDDPDFGPKLKDLVSGIQVSVAFVANRGDAAPTGAEDRLGSVVFTPRAAGKDPVAGGPTSLPVLCRGVLYALAPSDGRLRWSRRLGVDATAPPLRLPADALMPERFLVVASDQQALLALEAATGVELWRCGLDDAVAGAPIVIGTSHAVIPMASGRVAEIELAGGRRLGSYQLGQRLVGGVHQEGTGLVYVAGAQWCVYVLDVSQRKCVGLVATDHASGALAGPPQVLGRGGVEYLLVPVARGGQSLELRGYGLPIRDPQQPPLDPIVVTPGWSEEAPWQDGDKLALASDDGKLTLYGINQKGQRDPWLFPWTDSPYLLEAGPQRGRSQIVHASAGQFWVAAGGRVHRLDSIIDPKKGPSWQARWPAPPRVGSPLFAGLAWSEGGKVAAVAVVTQDPQGPTVWATCIDADSGRLLWKTQLGLTWQAPPILLGQRLVCRDSQGFAILQAGDVANIKEGETTSGRIWVPAPLGSEERRQWTVDAQGLVELSWRATAEGGRIKWRRLELDGQVLSADGEKDLPAAVAGAPLVFPDFVVVPLANGILARIEWATGQITLGPSWRAAGAEEDAACIGLAVSQDGFVIGDGRRGLTRWHWPQPANWQKKAAVELDHRALSLAWMAETKRLALRDAADQVVLLEGERLEPQRQWTLGGRITAGPFVRKGGLACVVEGKRLVWLELERAEPAWQSVFAAPLVGEPVLVDNRLVLSDQSGKFLVLDLATGDPGGPGYTMRANVAAAVTPLPLAAGRLFMPLCDGTAVVAPLGKLMGVPGSP